MDNNYIGDNTETWTKEVKKQEEEAEKELIEWKKLKRMEKIARLKENWKAKSNGKIARVLAIKQQDDGKHFACKSKFIFQHSSWLKKYSKNSH